jgi:sugar phosphate isomerase/epimerase
MLRREFLARLNAGAASAALGLKGDSSAGAINPRAAASAKLERIAISTWSLHSYFHATRGRDFNLSGPMLALPDFPALILDKYQVNHLEFCAVHFDSLEPAYLREIESSLAKTNSVVVNVLLDIKECGPDGTFSDPDRRRRAVAIDAIKQWMDIARELGTPSVRVDPGNIDRGNPAPTTESYQEIALYAQAKGMRVIVENVHAFGTEHPEEIVGLIKRVSPVSVGALPDFANFPDPATREKGLKMLFPYAPTVCHAKGVEFDALGVEKTFDFPQAIEISRQAGFRGVYSIEFNGPGDPYAGIQKTLDELLKYV